MQNKLINRGIGEWLILRYKPVSLFSLRTTYATNKGGKTLLVPTPYAFKMAMIDACFRAFGKIDEADRKAREVFDLIKCCEIRFSPPSVCIVQNTFIKIRQEKRDAPKGYFASTIAYREFCYFNNSELKIALGVKEYGEEILNLLVYIASHINCIGKRGSFWQYLGHMIQDGELSENYTRPKSDSQLSEGHNLWFHELDDFGQDLCDDKNGFDRISTYGEGKIELGKHRVLTKTIIPYRFKQSSFRFTEYNKI
jgi:hypothetical protein